MNAEPILPEFARPPVVEVALSVQFEPIKGLRAAELGLYWAMNRTRFPRVEEHFELPPTIERFEAPTEGPVIELRSADRPPTPRTWLLNEKQTELIQIQRDRFIHNWRKVEGEQQDYPRYSNIRNTFRDELKQYRDFLSQESLGPVKPNQCEVTYVNHIASGEGWQTHTEADKILTVWSNNYSDHFLRQPEDTSLAFRYAMNDSTGARIGRLNVTLKPAHSRQDKKPIFVLTLTARGAVSGEDNESVMRTLDVGHEWVVRGFASMTTPEMHRIWRRTDA